MLRLVLLVLYLAWLSSSGQAKIGGGLDPDGLTAEGDLHGNLDPNGLTAQPPSTFAGDIGGGLDPNG
jgi:hypothetical protein